MVYQYENTFVKTDSFHITVMQMIINCNHLVLTDVAVFSEVPMMPEFHIYTTQAQAIYKNKCSVVTVFHT